MRAGALEAVVVIEEGEPRIEWQRVRRAIRASAVAVLRIRRARCSKISEHASIALAVPSVGNCAGGG